MFGLIWVVISIFFLLDYKLLEFRGEVEIRKGEIISDYYDKLMILKFILNRLDN